MRIVFFTESMLPLVDGVSLTLSRLFTTLDDAGVDFRVYSPFVPPPEIPWSRRVHHVRSVTFPLYRDYKVSVPGGRKLIADLEAYNPDIVHVVSPTPMAMWAQTYAKARGIPVVATFHTHFVSYFRYYGFSGLEPLGWRILRWFHRRCAVTFAPTSTIVNELTAHGVPNVQLWSRGVDAQLFSPAARDATLRARLGADDDTPLILLVSRLVKEKDLADLVDVDRELRARGAEYRLALVGDGPLRARLQHDLPHAYFAGHQCGSALARWYASGDIFIFPSTTETFANVVQEAMAAGLPSVVVDRGGPQAVIEPGRSGFVARAHDTRDIADKLCVLIGDRELRASMSRAARARAQERTWDRVNDVLLTAYEALAGRHRELARRWA
jgi:glycosyltransferase involved in cell wall biosynthesis